MRISCYAQSLGNFRPGAAKVEICILSGAADELNAHWQPDQGLDCTR